MHIGPALLRLKKLLSSATNMDAIGGYDIFDLASPLFLFTVRGLDAKLLWRGADGTSSRISFSPPEGIRLNHDR